MNIPRSCGIILHITSLPSPFGVGDLGPSAYRFADFLESSYVRYWQILPLNYTDGGSGFSPYSGKSAFAGNTLLISPELLVEDGLLSIEDLYISDSFTTHSADYSKAFDFKMILLNLAYKNFTEHDDHSLVKQFKQFCRKEKDWLEEYAIYSALKKKYNQYSWDYWPENVKNRTKGYLKDLKKEIQEDVEKEKFFQFLFFKQWYALRDYCAQRSIKFIGDMPFYVGYDSSDVWQYPEYFKLDKDKKPLKVAGVPPDYFSETGQLWGMPVFNWKNLKKDDYSWWLKRVHHNIDMFGVVRLDHFRAFAACWEVDASEHTAMNGSWVKSPGMDFFKHLKKKYEHLPLIAEDLGEIDQPVRDLMDKFNLPGMKVLQFGFGKDMPVSIHIPHHHIHNSIAYTGTHDNNTLLGWFEHDLKEGEKGRIAEYFGREEDAAFISDDFIRITLQSVAQLAIFPLQDLMGLGEEAIMNRPSTMHGNWAWRFTDEMLTPDLSV
ncbi:MAG: 4-alpha-glucanotransferase, partial [Cytophagales bacterium]|nr:4-alpha-glucanotransferase [Cytophaga sp.]